MNQTALEIQKNSLLAAFVLFCFGVGVYLTIQANIGVAPCDAFCIGLSQKLGILCGTASIMMSLTIVVIDDHRCHRPASERTHRHSGDSAGHRLGAGWADRDWNGDFDFLYGTDDAAGICAGEV